jgi:ribosome-associated translation inhibitor RaiA
MSRSSERPTRVEQVEIVGAVPRGQRAYAAAKIGSLAQYAPVRAAHIAVGPAPGAGSEFSVRVNVSGDRVFAHAEAEGETVTAAVDLVRRRLYRQLTRRRRDHRSRVGAYVAHAPQPG